MTKKNYLCFIIICLMQYGVANAKDSSFDWNSLEKYFSVGGSYAFYSKIEGNFIHNRPKQTVFPNIALGIGKDNLYVELEGIYYTNHYSKTATVGMASSDIDYKLDYFTTLLNGYLFFKDLLIIDPFIGVGIGGSYVHNKTTSTIPINGVPNKLLSTDLGDIKTANFAYQAVAGVSKEINKSFYIESKLRWFSPGNFRNKTSKTTSTGRLNNVAVSFGLKFLF